MKKVDYIYGTDYISYWLGLAKRRKIIVYGAGESGLLVERYLREHNVSVSFFVDSMPGKWGRKANGLRIANPSCLEKEKNFIIVASDFGKEIKEKLCSEGWQEELDFSYEGYGIYVEYLQIRYGVLLQRLCRNMATLTQEHCELKGKLDQIIEKFNLIIHKLQTQQSDYNKNLEDEILVPREYLKYWLQLAQGRKLVVFGAGESGAVVVKYLHVSNEKIAFIADNDSDKWGKEMQELLISNPESINRIGHFVIVASDYWAEISIQLKKNGLIPEKDFTVRGYSNYIRPLIEKYGMFQAITCGSSESNENMNTRAREIYGKMKVLLEEKEKEKRCQR